jgi:hypothetical protein
VGFENIGALISFSCHGSAPYFSSLYPNCEVQNCRPVCLPNEKHQTIIQILLQKGTRQKRIQERSPNLRPKVSDDPLGLQTHCPDVAIFFGADNLPAKKSGSKKATETKPKISRGKHG